MEKSEEEITLPLVHVLISENFFWSKVEGALMGLERTPRLPDWEDDVKAQILANPGVALVADLEEERLDVLGLIAELRCQPGFEEMPMLGYCSHDQTELHLAAAGLGVEVIPRSTFAAALVRALGELKAAEVDNTEEE